MDQQIQVSNRGPVRNVIGCGEDNVEAAPGTTIGDLLQLLVAKHSDSFQKSVFRNGVESRLTARSVLIGGLILPAL